MLWCSMKQLLITVYTLSVSFMVSHHSITWILVTSVGGDPSAPGSLLNFKLLIHGEGLSRIFHGEVNLGLIHTFNSMYGIRLVL